VELNPLTAILNSNASLGVVIVLAIVLVLTSAIRHLSKMDYRLVPGSCRHEARSCVAA
jgi:hypothetical protein